MSENNIINNNNNNNNNTTTEKKEIEQPKDIMKEKANEIKSVYDQMIKLRKQNLDSSKKFDSSKLNKIIKILI
jgi:hypothetical protein